MARDKNEILRSSCMSCDCVEYILRRNNRCKGCGCLAASHYKVEFAGSYNNEHTNKKVTKGKDVKLWGVNFPNHFTWFSIVGVDSLSLISTQKQIVLGIFGLLMLASISLFLPMRTGLLAGSHFTLRINSVCAFLISSIVAWRAFSLSQRVSKKVTAASLLAINAFMAFSYTLLAIGIFPRLYSASGALNIEPARIIISLVLWPSLCHLIGDVTSNNIDMTWFTRIVYIELLFMFLSQLSPSSSIFLAIQLISFGLIVVGIDRVFAIRPSMMDNTSNYLARFLILTGSIIIQTCWMLETGDIIGFGLSEICRNVADVTIVSGFTVVVALSDMSELEEY